MASTSAHSHSKGSSRVVISYSAGILIAGWTNCIRLRINWANSRSTTSLRSRPFPHNRPQCFANETPQPKFNKQVCPHETPLKRTVVLNERCQQLRTKQHPPPIFFFSLDQNTIIGYSLRSSTSRRIANRGRIIASSNTCFSRGVTAISSDVTAGRVLTKCKASSFQCSTTSPHTFANWPTSFPPDRTYYKNTQWPLLLRQYK